MKVKLEEKYRERYTLENLDRAKRVIAAEKEDTETAACWAKYAAEHIARHCLDGYCSRIIEASAETALNNRVWNAWGDDTGKMDIWIDFIAKIDGRLGDGFIEGGAYLSDIHGITGVNDLTGHMYYKYYKRS